MQYSRNKIRKLGEVRVGFIILGVGFLLGIILSRVLKDSYWNQIDLLDAAYLSKIKNAVIDYSVLLRYVLWRTFSIFILFWILSATVLGIPYITLTLIYTGFQCGFFLSIILMGYGLKGILLILGYTFPHYIIYIPVAMLCLRSGYWLCTRLYHESKISSKSKVKIVTKHMIVIMILGVLLFIGALLETYAGTFILRKILLLF
jgi:stage II sporulation protein M